MNESMSRPEPNPHDLRARLFKALANPHRLAILERLAACCAPGVVWQVPDSAAANVGDLGSGLGIAGSTLSHHLKELVHAGLIRTERRGKNVVCWLDPDVLRDLADYFKSLLVNPQTEIPDLRARAE